MQSLLARFDKIFIDLDAINDPLSKRLRSLCPLEKIEVVNSLPFKNSKGELSAYEFDRSKRNLYLTRFKGQFFKRCPGSRPGLTCCNYFVLNWGLQCDMNCSYCYLQSFINTPVLTIYTNLDQALAELSSLDESMGQQSLRVGTGETVDSLSLDPITLYSHELIRFFKDRPNWTLEFKTKSNRVDQFLGEPHARNVIVSWSINPQNVIAAEEHGTASLQERLDAAEKCLNFDFQVAFHIDPMIYHPGWQENYAALVDEIVRRFRPADLPYMSVGALRFQPEQRAMMRERFGMKSYVTQAEVFPSADGKWRYDAALRQQMFDFLKKRFLEHSEKYRIFMCMETPETWLKSDGASPFQQEKWKDLFDPSVVTGVKRGLKGLTSDTPLKD